MPRADHLYAAGWRQGMLLETALPLEYVRLEPNGVASHRADHGAWVLVTQDCDLDGTDIADPRLCVELRPTYALQVGDGRKAGSIRDRWFVYDERYELDSRSPRTMITAAALSTLVAFRGVELPLPRKQQLRTWLGKRYDRPALPDEYIAAAKIIGKEVERNRHSAEWPKMRDLLVSYQPPRAGTTTPIVRLYAIIFDERDRSGIRTFIDGIAATVTKRDVAAVIEAHVATDREVTLQLLENTYAADLSKLSIEDEPHS